MSLIQTTVNGQTFGAMLAAGGGPYTLPQGVQYTHNQDTLRISEVDAEEVPTGRVCVAGGPVSNGVVTLDVYAWEGL